MAKKLAPGVKPGQCTVKVQSMMDHYIEKVYSSKNFHAMSTPAQDIVEEAINELENFCTKVKLIRKQKYHRCMFRLQFTLDLKEYNQAAGRAYTQITDKFARTKAARDVPACDYLKAMREYIKTHIPKEYINQYINPYHDLAADFKAIIKSYLVKPQVIVAKVLRQSPITLKIKDVFQQHTGMIDILDQQLVDNILVSVGKEATDILWRPTETLPEDYYTP